jgi:N-carbamoyl-L-amino-acid hydrolase
VHGRVVGIWNIEPVSFHPALIELCEVAIAETTGSSHRMPSGPLHDAAEVARAGIPTVMMFVQSLKGISHNKIEDTAVGDLELAVGSLAGWRASRCTGLKSSKVYRTAMTA